MFIKRAEYCDILIGATSTKQVIYFPDLPNLRTAKIFGLEVYTADTQQYSLNGNTVQAETQIKNSVTTLYFDGGDFIQIPTLSLYRNDATGFYGNIPELAGQRIVWPKSYITLTDVAGITGYQNKSFVYSIYYSY